MGINGHRIGDRRAARMSASSLASSAYRRYYQGSDGPSKGETPCKNEAAYDEGKKDDRRDDMHSSCIGPPPRFVMAVLYRGGKLCPAEQTPSRKVKLKVFSNAKQILSQMDI